MDFYQINDLERLSGIKAHTIRIWEKRYNLINPYRSDTNIRYYDDEQLKKLLNVATLAASGIKISRIAALTPEEMKALIKEQKGTEGSEDRYEFYINDLIASMLDFDEEAFNRVFEKIVVEFGTEEAVIKVIYPFLSKTGILWSVDEATPVQEHFAATVIKKKLFSLINNLPAPLAGKSRFLLFLPANEWHELGLLFAEYLIRKNGNTVISLGQNVPFSDIEFVMQKVKPKHLLTFLINEVNSDEIGKICNLLLEKFRSTTLLLCGDKLKLESYIDKPQLKVLRHPDDILKFI